MPEGSNSLRCFYPLPCCAADPVNFVRLLHAADHADHDQQKSKNQKTLTLLKKTEKASFILDFLELINYT